MSTVVAPVGHHRIGVGHRPSLRDSNRHRDVAAAAPARSGGAACAGAGTNRTSETWVEGLLIALSVALAAATWTLLSGSVIR